MGDYSVSVMDLKDLPNDHLEARVILLTEGAKERAQATLDHIRGNSALASRLDEYLDFAQYDILDCMRSDWDSLARVWVFPATEAADELSESLNRLLDCAYKAARDNMRRALELIAVGVYLGAAHVSADEARKWLDSTRCTPFFSRTVDELATLPRFDTLTKRCNWADDLKSFDWVLSDTIHTRGVKHSIRQLQPSQLHINSMWLPQFAAEHLDHGLRLWMQTIEHLCVLLAAYNPVLLVGLPLTGKFGIDGPLSGFFEEGQSAALWKLLPAKYHEVFREIASDDSEVASIRDWIESLPDWQHR